MGTIGAVTLPQWPSHSTTMGLDLVKIVEGLCWCEMNIRPMLVQSLKSLHACQVRKYRSDVENFKSVEMWHSPFRFFLGPASALG